MYESWGLFTDNELSKEETLVIDNLLENNDNTV